MASIDEAFSHTYKMNSIFKVDNQDSIDYFFTQRKISEFEEYVDTKDMVRKKKKKDISFNFIAITIPYFEFIKSSENTDDNSVVAEINVYGNVSFKYHGVHESKEGYFPSILLKLGEDSQLFVNVKLKNGDKDENGREIVKEFVSFIPISKRYQIEPSINDGNSDV